MLRVAQQQKMEFSLMSDIKLHSAQYSKFDPTYFKTEGKGTFDGTRWFRASFIFKIPICKSAVQFSSLPCFYFNDKALNPLLPADKTC